MDLSNIYQHTEIEEWLDAITEVESALYKSDPFELTRVLDAVSSKIRETLLKDGNTPDIVKKNIEYIKSSFKDIPEVRVIIAIDLPKIQKDAIAQKVKEIFGKNVITRIEIDETILGGAVIESDGKILDASIKENVQKFINGL
jgi:F0F1-type ATP synthase delta subunit